MNQHIESCSETIEKSGEILNILLNGKENYVFGCGWMGQRFFTIALLLQTNITGFIVTQKSQDEFWGKPVYEISEISDKERNIFIALRDQDSNLSRKLESISRTLVAIKYPEDIASLEARFYFEYLSQKKVDCTSKSIILQKFRFINPFYKPYDFMLSWVYEAGDLLLPILYGDFSRIDEGPYEIENTLLEPGDTVLDCGANIGLFSSVAVQKGCKVYAFEPMPEAISYLREVKDMMGENLRICPYALSDKEGKAEFLVQNDDLIGASLFEGHNSVDKRYTVDVTTIDNFVDKFQLKRVDFIKADIEGAERDMIKGAEKTIKKYLPKISICTYHLADDKEVLENLIRNMSDRYVIEHKWKKLYAYVPKD